MSRRSRAALLACCLLAAACGGEAADPDRRIEDWEPAWDRTIELAREERHAEAVAVGEEYLKKHPDSTDAHLLLADAALRAGQAAADASRHPRFELALTHYRRVLELSNNSISRTQAMVGSIQATGAKGLNRPAESERLARLFVAEDPTNLIRSEHLVAVLKDAKRYPDLVKVFDELRTTAVFDADTTAQYGGMVHDAVTFSEGFPPETAGPLLAGAVALNAKELAADPRHMKLLNSKGMLLRAQANIESDPVRQKALREQSQAAFDEYDRLDKR